MVENITRQNSILLPFEVDYIRLQKQLVARRKQRGQDLNIDTLTKVLVELMAGMERYGNDEYIPKSRKNLYDSSGAGHSAFERNLKSFNGIFIETKGLIVSGIDRAIRGDGPEYSYNRLLDRVFEYVAGHTKEPRQDQIIRLRFAAFRFSVEFWEMALHRLFPFFVQKKAAYCSLDARLLLYYQAAGAFQKTLKYWSGKDFDPQCMEAAMELFKNLDDDFSDYRRSMIEKALVPFAE